MQCAYINILLLIRQKIPLDYAYEYIPVDIGWCWCVDEINIRLVIAAWLNTFQINIFERPKDMIQRDNKV